MGPGFHLSLLLLLCGFSLISGDNGVFVWHPRPPFFLPPSSFVPSSSFFPPRGCAGLPFFFAPARLGIFFRAPLLFLRTSSPLPSLSESYFFFCGDSFPPPWLGMNRRRAGPSCRDRRFFRSPFDDPPLQSGEIFPFGFKWMSSLGRSPRCFPLLSPRWPHRFSIIGMFIAHSVVHAGRHFPFCCPELSSLQPSFFVVAGVCF